jgi:hypothetical protein
MHGPLGGHDGIGAARRGPPGCARRRWLGRDRADPHLVLGEGVGTAAVTSLLIVAVTAASGAIAHGRAGTVTFRTALALSAGSAAGSWPGSLLRAEIGGRTYLLAFALLLALASILVWRRPTAARGRGARECVIEPDLRSCAKLGAAGLTLGFLTGSGSFLFLGAGGVLASHLPESAGVMWRQPHSDESFRVSRSYPRRCRRERPEKSPRRDCKRGFAACSEEHTVVRARGGLARRSDSTA